MARPNRALILANIQASLRGIAGDGSPGTYKTTAVTVERSLRDPQAIPALLEGGGEATPWFGAVPNGEETVRHMTGGWVEKVLRVIVAGAVAIPQGAVADPDDPLETIDAHSEVYRAEVSANLIDDIKFALCGTQALSERGTHTNDAGQVVPNAISTTITSEWTDEGHEIADVLEGDRVIAYAVVRAEIKFQERRGHA